uniref:Uncharacterized protein n=1 Tax=Picea glauca TaxID=3330 RepID=A0A101LYK3_PICGL|nr:hypothetical protein ABT39_MTgene5764 [Picea glauca]QHR90463.1 hypothetical protein Q903MT_gene4487 [Picea sitchensis]
MANSPHPEISKPLIGRIPSLANRPFQLNRIPVPLYTYTRFFSFFNWMLPASKHSRAQISTYLLRVRTRPCSFRSDESEGFNGTPAPLQSRKPIGSDPISQGISETKTPAPVHGRLG